jgi:phosphoglucomutase
MDTTIKSKAEEWLKGNFDEATKQEVKRLIEEDGTEIVDSFYRTLEFGTGGLRGIMGAGTNRMNIYTVGMATQGLSNYLIKNFKGEEIKVAVAYDSRNNSKLFAETTAKIFAANGFKVYLFDALRPTPELSFAIRHFGCKSGVVITASHNPKEYNGYKAYWDDGGQVIPPHDKNIITEVENITSIDAVKWSRNDGNIQMVGKEVDEVYTDLIKALSLNPECIAKHKDMKIVYTPIHGSGVELVPMALKKYGFTNIITVPEQQIVDGNFPTVKSPNPEESATLKMATDKAKEVGAELVLATDPDADRVGIAIKNDKGELILMNGNQTAAILIYYLLSQWKAKGKIQGKEYIVKTIVTTELLADMATKFGVEYFDVLTGFKYIAEIIKQLEGKKKYIGGGEESYGYLAGEFVRDKDAVMACSLIAEAAAWAKDQGKMLYDVLLDIYVEFGFYKESLLNITKKGKSGAEEIQAMMAGYRQNPPMVINGSKVVLIKDYKEQVTKDFVKGTTTRLDMSKSDVLQFFTEDGSKISIRPSGTEPKIKFYFGIKEALCCKEKYEEVNQKLDDKLNNIIKSLNL